MGATCMAVLMVSEQKHSSGGNRGMVVASAHNTPLSGQIGEQLLRAICLTSPIVVASEKGNATALPTDSYRGLRLHGGAGGLCPCLTLTGSQMLALRLGEGLAAGDVAQRCPECWTVCSLSAKGYPLLVPRAGGGQLGMHASVNTLDLNAQREQACVLPWRMFLQTESVIVIMCNWWDKCSILSVSFTDVRCWVRTQCHISSQTFAEPAYVSLCSTQITQGGWFVSKHVIV